jgi:hypothetical protein
VIDVALALVVVVAVVGAAVGLRELYLRLDRPGGIACSLRVRDGHTPGVGAVFRTGYLGPEPERLLWRRLVWPGPHVPLPRDGVLLDEGRRAVRGERWTVPATFVIVPVTLADGAVLELALPRRRVAQLAALLEGRTASTGLRAARRRAGESRTRGFWAGPREPGAGRPRR